MAVGPDHPLAVPGRRRPGTDRGAGATVRRRPGSPRGASVADGGLL